MTSGPPRCVTPNPADHATSAVNQRNDYGGDVVHEHAVPYPQRLNSRPADEGSWQQPILNLLESLSQRSKESWARPSGVLPNETQRMAGTRHNRDQAGGHKQHYPIA